MQPAQENPDLNWSEEKYKSVFDLSPQAILILDKKGRVVDVNKRIEEWLGFPVGEVMGKTILDMPFLEPADKALAIKKFGQRLLGKEVPVYELGFKDKSGERKIGRVRGVLIKDQAGKVVGDLVMISDATELYKIDQALKKERKMFKKYLDVVGMMIVVLGVDGKVKLVNKKTVEVLGFSEKEMVGKSWFDNFLPKEVREEVWGVFSRLMSKKVSPVEFFENSVLSKNGKQKMIAWHNTVIEDESGKVIGTIGSGKDVTEEKKHKVEMKKQSTELKKMNELMIGRELKMAELKKDLKKHQGG